MLRNRSDVKLVDGGFLLARLRTPVRGRAAKKDSLRMSLRNFRRRIIEEQALCQFALVLGDGREALDAFGVDDREIETCLGAIVKKNGIDHLARSGRQAE